MAADSDGCSNDESVTTVVTCEGDLADPGFRSRFRAVVDRLGGLLLLSSSSVDGGAAGRRLKVRKLEPWNSVRVTLSVPREAASRLRQLANEGSQQLRALGILSVQVEGDQVISLRLAGTGGAEPQEIVLRTAQDGGSSSSSADGPSSAVEPIPVVEKVQFRSPNVVCPPDTIVPKVPTPVVTNSVSTAAAPSAVKSFAAGPFPFASMNQAIHHSRDNTSASNGAYATPPPPYPGKHPAVTLSSPLLVNLLQNEGAPTTKQETVVNGSFASFVQKTVAKAPPSYARPSVSHPNPTVTPTTVKTPRPTVRPCPPPYPEWEPPNQFLEITPTLTDLKADDLDDILPSLERDLAGTPPDLPGEMDRRNFLVNPLTGELEPQSSSDSENDGPSDVFSGLASPALSDEDTNSTITRPDTTDQSDSETRSSHSDSGRHSRLKSTKNRGRESPGIKPTEKIKLRLKLEKSEPVSPAYKVDVSFINTQQPKKASTSPVTAVAAEEPRVPPLHISLRGRNHVVINSKKKAKFNPDGTPKIRKADKSEVVANTLSVVSLVETDSKKLKKPKPIYEQMVGMYNSHYKEKLKERRGSDSELAKKYGEVNGVLPIDKKRRLSQTEQLEPSVLGSTNTGTVMSLTAHKPRKEKLKIKETFKNKELNRNKNFPKALVKQVTLPTGEIDMEAKFKQRLLEEPEKGVTRPPHRTETAAETPTPPEKVPEVPKEKPPELPDKTENLINDKQPGRSPNSGAQGEDSGIESMDALSEKSPNQASQSPHAEITTTTTTTTTTKTQVPDMLDIEAQLAKMEGLNSGSGGEDLNENKRSNGQAKNLEQCCGLKGESQEITAAVATPKEEDLEPLPVRVTPPLYTYSNPEKSRGTDSPSLSDSDNSNSCSTVKSTSLLEQLLIEIPDHQTAAPNSPSPAARSLRTRATSKLNSPELNSPVVVQHQKKTAVLPAKRKRRESDSSNNSVEDVRGKKTRKCSENAAELIKACMGVEAVPKNTAKKNVKVTEESSDSDEPLIEKVRKNSVNSAVQKGKVKTTATTGIVKAATVNTRRSVRTIPALNTRSKGDKVQPEADVLRRKTRSTVSEVEGKRRKDVK